MLEDFKKHPFMGILRGITLSDVPNIIEVSVSAGLKYIEVTLNTENAFEIIAEMVKVSAGRVVIGAGTVLTKDGTLSALNAGAQFIVSPTLVDEVMAVCKERDIPTFPGAFTPQEVYNAWLAGATMVKLFPAKFFGAEYIKEIKGPFNDIEILACGGVSSSNASEFFTLGSSAVAFGGSIFNLNQMKNGEWDKIETSLRELITAI